MSSSGRSSFFRREGLLYIATFVLSVLLLSMGGRAYAYTSQEPARSVEGRNAPGNKASRPAPDNAADRAAERRALRDYVRRGMERPSRPPVRHIQSVEQVLGRVPRFTQHTYFDPAWQRQLDLATRSELTAGNSMRLLPNRDSWQAKSDLMEKARDTLYVTAMIMRCDEGGQEFARGMIDAAQRGVDTRFILDALFSLSASPCLSEMREGGVKVVLSLRSLRPDMFDWEMHEKLFIVDGEVAITGGQNVGSWYQDSDGLDRNYRDTDVLLEGPIVRQLARRFVTLWTSLRPEDSSLWAYLDLLEDLDEADRSAGLLGSEHYPAWLAPGNRSGLCRFVAQDPHEGTFYVWEAYQRYLDAAQRRVMLTSYALDPDGSPTQDRFRDSLIRLAERPGAQVDIITNGSGVGASNVVRPWVAKSYSENILERAFKGFGRTPVRISIYHYFMHAKQYYFDGVAAGIGSFNYDASGNKCQESVVICIDPGLVEGLEQLYAVDFANTTLLSGEQADPGPDNYQVVSEGQQMLKGAGGTR